MLIDGKKIASEILADIEQAVAQLGPKKPTLAFVLVGEHPASVSYVKSKNRACEKTGINSILIALPDTITEAHLISEIEKLNHDPNVDGILVQLPLPKQIREQFVLQRVDPNKDVDGFHPINLGKLVLGDESGFIPCTPKGIQTLLQRSGVSLEKKRVVILGRSNIVGKPLMNLLIQKKEGANATVTLAHSYTSHLEELIQSAEILIAAIGKPHFVRGSMVKKGAVVIDVGINRTEEGKIVGDVAFDEVSKVASLITPVPRGVGPMTIAMLLTNTLLSFSRRHGK